METLCSTEAAIIGNFVSTEIAKNGNIVTAFSYKGTASKIVANLGNYVCPNVAIVVNLVSVAQNCQKRGYYQFCHYCQSSVCSTKLPKGAIAIISDKVNSTNSNIQGIIIRDLTTDTYLPLYIHVLRTELL